MSARSLIRSTVAFVLAALAVSFAAVALAAGGVVVADAHVRLVPPSAENTAVFMRLNNHDGAERRLVAADSTAARKVELHTVIHEGDVMKMRPVAAIAIPAHGETRLQPGGLHVMLLGLRQALQEGDPVALTLKFDDGSQQLVTAPVRRIGSHGGGQ